jgi:hypothetical protein
MAEGGLPLSGMLRESRPGAKEITMGRTLPSAAQNFMQEEASFARFRRALRRRDQLVLDDLFASARQHLAAAQYAAHALPFEVFLLSMLLEEHKEVMQLRDKVETLGNKLLPDEPDRPGLERRREND